MSVDDVSASWFLAQLKPNCARIADRNLTRQGFRTFLPVEDITKRAKSKFVTTERPVFPGYIFVLFDASKGGWQAINSTSGITRLVGFGGAPAAVPDEIVSGLMMRCDVHGKLKPQERFEPGARVALTRGPFADVIADIDQIEADQRVWVLLDIMGGKTRVAVNSEDLRQL